MDPLPTSAAGLKGARLDTGYLLMFGGYDGANTIDSIWIFGGVSGKFIKHLYLKVVFISLLFLESWGKVGNLTYPRSYHAVSVLKDISCITK